MRTPSSAAAAATCKTPCCSKVGIKRGPWTPEEDEILANFVQKEGEGRWRTLPKRAGLQRCGKSCRLRWMNYLRPSVKRGQIAPDEEDLILRLHRLLGNRWSLIAGRIPGRTDNDIKNYWNTHLSKKLIRQGIDPRTHKPLVTDSILNPNFQSIDHESNTTSNPHPTHQAIAITTPAPEIGSYSNQANGAESGEHHENIEGRMHSIAGNWPSYDNVMGLQRGAEVGDGRNIVGEEDTFTSFLDSLINDNELGSGHQQQHQADNNVSSIPCFSLAFWEAELRSAVNTFGDEQYNSLFK